LSFIFISIACVFICIFPDVIIDCCHQEIYAAKILSIAAEVCLERNSWQQVLASLSLFLVMWWTQLWCIRIAEEELIGWHERFQHRLSLGSNTEQLLKAAWVVEPKVDGLALSLLYKGGKLVRAATRGDGYQGSHQRLDSSTSADLSLFTEMEFPPLH
jgi:hypothetical protein